MSMEYAIRWTEILMGFAFTLQSLEHLWSKAGGQYLFLLRLVLSLLLMVGLQTPWVALLLFMVALLSLKRFQGPYNGGADRMSVLLLCCLCLVYFLPELFWKEVAFGYLALQLLLSYFISGWVKLVNPQWRNGKALADVFMYSAYPVSESLRGWARSSRLLLFMSWAVILFELLFPLSLLSPVSLLVALSVAAVFHFANACLFGLNRFFWIWLAAYPSIIWFQSRFIQVVL